MVGDVFLSKNAVTGRQLDEWVRLAGGGGGGERTSQVRL